MIFPFSWREVYSLSCIPYFEKRHWHYIRTNDYRVSVHADMLKIKKLNAPPPKHGKFKRGIVTGFSKKSRKRMLEILAMVKTPPTLFLTITFADDTYADENFDPNYYFELFRKWLQYHYPTIKCIWRKEAEPRKSGEFKGDYVPHFHMLIWLLSDKQTDVNSLLKGKGKTWREAWHKITGSKNYWHEKRYGLQLERIASRRHAYHYVSKYAAKEASDTRPIGRRWGTVGELDVSPMFEQDISFSEFIQLKRLITSKVKQRYPHLAKAMKNRTPKVGVSVFGIGGWDDVNNQLDVKFVGKLLQHIIEIANDKIMEKTE